jgi:hypothetical protein
MASDESGPDWDAYELPSESFIAAVDDGDETREGRQARTVRFCRRFGVTNMIYIKALDEYRASQKSAQLLRETNRSRESIRQGSGVVLLACMQLSAGLRRYFRGGVPYPRDYIPDSGGPERCLGGLREFFEDAGRHLLDAALLWGRVPLVHHILHDTVENEDPSGENEHPSGEHVVALLPSEIVRCISWCARQVYEKQQSSGRFTRLHACQLCTRMCLESLALRLDDSDLCSQLDNEIPAMAERGHITLLREVVDFAASRRLDSKPLPKTLDVALKRASRFGRSDSVSLLLELKHAASTAAVTVPVADVRLLTKKGLLDTLQVVLRGLGPGPALQLPWDEISKQLARPRAVSTSHAKCILELLAVPASRVLLGHVGAAAVLATGQRRIVQAGRQPDVEVPVPELRAAYALCAWGATALRSGRRTVLLSWHASRCSKAASD